MAVLLRASAARRWRRSWRSTPTWTPRSPTPSEGPDPDDHAGHVRLLPRHLRRGPRAQLRRDPGRPLVTYYDHATGERVELSVTTYANWVAKTASLLVEEHDLERGEPLRVDLPDRTGWAGLPRRRLDGRPGRGTTVRRPGRRRVRPGRPGRVGRPRRRLPVLACSLRPMGVRFAEPLPAGVHDVGVEVWSQPDAFTAWDPPTGDDLAADGLTQAELWGAAAAGSLLTDGGRLLSEANPASPPGIATFTEPLARGGSLVLVRNPTRRGSTTSRRRAGHGPGLIALRWEPVSRPGRRPPVPRRGRAGGRRRLAAGVDVRHPARRGRGRCSRPTP